MYAVTSIITRPSIDTPSYHREDDEYIFYIKLHLDGLILLEKRTFSEDLLTYTIEIRWVSEEVYNTVKSLPEYVMFDERRSKFFSENNIIIQR